MWKKTFSLLSFSAIMPFFITSCSCSPSRVIDGDWTFEVTGITSGNCSVQNNDDITTINFSGARSNDNYVVIHTENFADNRKGVGTNVKRDHENTLYTNTMYMYFATDEQISTLQNCSSATELIALFLNISTRCPTTICLTNNDGTEELDTSSIASPPIGVEESILSEYFRFGLGVSYDSNNQVVVYNVVVINLITINSNIFNAVFNYTITNNKIAVGWYN